MNKITLLVGGAVGYVLGARAGRERYEQIKNQAQSLWTNPKVQQKADPGAGVRQGEGADRRRQGRRRRRERHHRRQAEGRWLEGRQRRLPDLGDHRHRLSTISPTAG